MRRAVWLRTPISHEGDAGDSDRAPARRGVPAGRDGGGWMPLQHGGKQRRQRRDQWGRRRHRRRGRAGFFDGRHGTHVGRGRLHRGSHLPPRVVRSRPGQPGHRKQRFVLRDSVEPSAPLHTQLLPDVWNRRCGHQRMRLRRCNWKLLELYVHPADRLPARPERGLLQPARLRIDSSAGDGSAGQRVSQGRPLHQDERRLLHRRVDAELPARLHLPVRRDHALRIGARLVHVFRRGHDLQLASGNPGCARRDRDSLSGRLSVSPICVSRRLVRASHAANGPGCWPRICVGDAGSPTSTGEPCRP